MSTSYVQFRGYGFWCSDTLLEIFAYLVGSELRAASPGSLGGYGVELMEKAQAGLVGCFDLRLDALTEQHLALLEESSVAVLSRAEVEPFRLSAGELNRLRLGTFSSDVPVVLVAALVHMLKELLHGRWSFDASDEEALPSYWMKSMQRRLYEKHAATLDGFTEK